MVRHAGRQPAGRPETPSSTLYACCHREANPGPGAELGAASSCELVLYAKLSAGGVISELCTALNSLSSFDDNAPS